MKEQNLVSYFYFKILSILNVIDFIHPISQLIQEYKASLVS